ncbi:MAG: oligopeptide:H+ symporter, partial [Burkholderiales bacterium]|nr:oligopeptide:H+ symporter [Burkholderiales bacterium]
MSAQGVKIKGVLALSSIEVWERMSFYTMQAILVLYASATTLKGGLGWTESDALRLTGLYGALVYCSPIIGGYLADKFIGHKRSTLIGAVIMMFGHGSLAISGQFAFFVGITLLIIGSGFLKPAISAMVGEFYPRTEETNKQSAFAIFYMAINIGSLLGTLIAGPISSTYGYNYAFGFAAFGLVVAIINILVTKNKSLRNVGNLTKKDINEIKK